MYRRVSSLQGCLLAVVAICVLLELPAMSRRSSHGEEILLMPAGGRGWGPEQASGPPNTPQAGDITTAWASSSPDGQPEWLLLDYAKPVVPKAVLVYETYNPEALNKVSAFKPDGSEVEVWSGKDPTPPAKKKGIAAIPVKVEYKVKRVKIYLDSPAVQGWNEIDAVGLRDATGKTQWATKVQASSTFAQRQQGNLAPFQVLQQRVIQLEAENRELKKKIAELTEALKEKQKKD